MRDKNRIERVIDEMKKRHLTQLLITDPTSIYYLTGIRNYPGERFYGFLVRNDGWHILFANRLFNIPAVPFETVWYDDTDDVAEVVTPHINNSKPLGVDKDLQARFLLPLIARNPEMAVGVASECVDHVRAIKDEQERELMRTASIINDQVNEAVSQFVRIGMTEREVAAFVDNKYLELGADGNSFSTIVCFGKNAADPHHGPDDTVLQPGEVVLIDMGCKKDGYCSDMTRTFFAGSTNEKQIQVYELVKQANMAAEAMIKPGVRLCDIDATARNIISDGGYGQYFTHRLGHFIGMTVHEYGNVASNFTQKVEPGMIFSIEPGIYLPGEFGVRIEDLVMVTEEGCEVLNHVSKEWKIIAE